MDVSHAPTAMIVLSWFFAILAYFIPTYIAWKRKHFHLLSIAVINTVLGFTGLGWLAAFVWSFRD